MTCISMRRAEQALHADTTAIGRNRLTAAAMQSSGAARSAFSMLDFLVRRRTGNDMHHRMSLTRFNAASHDARTHKYNLPEPEQIDTHERQAALNSLACATLSSGVQYGADVTRPLRECMEDRR